MSVFQSTNGNSTELGSPPETPTESRRSRFDHFESLSPSPMIKITEEEVNENPIISSADLPSLPTSKRFSGHYSSPKMPTPSSSGGGLYSLDNNSSSSLLNPGNRNSMTSFNLKYVPPPPMPMRNKSPVRNNRSPSPARQRSVSPVKAYSPFNFQSTNLSATPVPAINSRTSHRKGHRYKHSSVSMNLFREPKQRAPLKIPTAFPIPTKREFFSSCNSEQKLKAGWNLFHLFVALVTYLIGFRYSLHSFSTLSHLMFYDALSCLAVVFVDIMGNFDVWNKSSITYPFGLGRTEVLFGFGLSISLIFVGCDLVSHFIEESVFEFFDHHNGSGSSHGHSSGHSHSSSEEIPLVIYEATIFFVLITSFLSSHFITLSSKKQPSENATKYDLSSLQKTIISNPTNIITLLFASYLSVSPLITSIKSDIEINQIATLIISLLIVYMGWKVVRYLAFILFLSFPGIDNSKNSILIKIKQRVLDLDVFKSGYQFENIVLSKVHMNLVIILVHVRMYGGSDDDEVSLRTEINNILNEMFQGKETIESTIDIDRI